jgi:hypothetical protein
VREAQFTGFSSVEKAKLKEKPMWLMNVFGERTSFGQSLRFPSHKRMP